MTPIIDHIQITVKDLSRAEMFYDQLMPLFGFDLSLKTKGRVDAHDFDVIEYVHPKLTIGINSPRSSLREVAVHRRRPGSLHHLAFKADSEQHVDAFYRNIKAINADIVNPPRHYPEHGERYYALFFKDPDGIKLEVMYEPTNH